MDENKKPVKYVLAILLIIIISIGTVVWGIKSLLGDNNSSELPVCTAEMPDDIKIEILKEPTGDFPWWDNEYPFYRQITIQNQGKNLIPGKCLISLQFDHGYLVDQKKSRGDGADLRLVKHSGNKYEEIPFYLDNADTGAAHIQFQMNENLEKGNNTSQYFLYYGKLGATSNKYLNESTNKDELYAQKYSLEFSREVQTEITGQVDRLWVLKGADEFSELNYTVSIDSSLATGRNKPSYKILGTAISGNLSKNEFGDFEVNIPTGQLNVGEYELQSSITIDKKTYTSPKCYFVVSYPLYVTFTIDYEGTDVPDNELAEVINFSERHNDLPIVHFFNPRIYVTKEISQERANSLTSWVIERRNAGDEIGMHLHMHYDMIKAAGVKVRKSPKWTNYLDNGHDVPCSAYTYNEFMKILKWALENYGENGLGLPISFRAGGWFADEKILKAVSDSGFVIDSSGRTPYSWGSNNLRGHWDLSPLTRPYQPSIADQNSIYPAPSLRLWEFPNNGADSYFYDQNELIDRFKNNFNSKPLKFPQTLTYLSHPHAFSEDLDVLDPTFDYINKYLAVRDRGPVIYITLQGALINQNK
ncbi:MAG: hypothetical protein ABIE03_06175 [Patescibacteria group bacterium]|nr:hypothetical protein [Patescibacteria group bacterium]